MLLRLFFGGLYLNKGVLARFRHGLLHLNCSWHWWWLLNPKATTGPELSAPLPNKEPRFGGAFSYLVSEALYAFKSNEFGGEIGKITTNIQPKLQTFSVSQVRAIQICESDLSALVQK